MACADCQKSCLSFLLLRPSPVAKNSAIEYLGTKDLYESEAMVAAVPPTLRSQIKKSAIALRLLRRGFVHIYMPQAAAGQDKWRIYHVDEAGNMRLIAPGFPVPAPDKKIVPCTSPQHDTYGQKLITIPNASAMTEVWLAFSANFWSDKLRKQNQANPKVMHLINPMAGGANTFKPTVENLQKHVLECATDTLRLAPPNRPRINLTPTYPFAPLMGAGHNQHYNPHDNSRVRHLAQALKDAAAASPRTAGKELAIVLHDPVALRRELSDLRLLMQNHLVERSNPNEDMKLRSHYILEGLANSVADMRAVNAYLPIFTKERFDEYMERDRLQGEMFNHRGAAVRLGEATRIGRTLEGATWQPIYGPDEAWDKRFGAHHSPKALGRMFRPGVAQRMEQNKHEFQDKARAELRKGYDHYASQSWVNELNAKCMDILKPYEADWIAARSHSSVDQYFALHFDESDRNTRSVVSAHDPGLIYAQESAEDPAPITNLNLLKRYLDQYTKSLSDPSAYAQKTLFGNQGSLKIAYDNLTGEANADGMRDKTVDLLKVFVNEEGNLSKIAEKLQLKLNHKWLSGTLISIATSNTMLLLNAITLGFKLGGGQAWLDGNKHIQKVAKGAAAWISVLEQGLNARAGLTIQRPMMIHFEIEAHKISKALNGPGRSRQSAKHNKWVPISILTTSDEIVRAQGKLEDLLKNAKPAERAIGDGNIRQLAAQHPSTQALHGGKFAVAQALFEQQALQAKSLGGTLKSAVALAPGAVHQITIKTEGRMAIAGMVVNLIGILNGMKAYDDKDSELTKAKAQKASPEEIAEAEKAVKDAMLGIADSAGGFTAGLLDAARVGTEYMLSKRSATAKEFALAEAAAEAAKKAGKPAPPNMFLSTESLKFGAAFAGTFGGCLNAVMSYDKFDDAKEKGLTEVSHLHLIASAAYLGTGALSLATLTVSGAQMLVIRGSTSLTARGILSYAGRFALQAWSGPAGWVLLGLGVGSSIYAAILDPTPLQAWARQTPFGNGPENQKFKTLKEQEAALLKALGVAETPPQESNP